MVYLSEHKRGSEIKKEWKFAKERKRLIKFLETSINIYSPTDIVDAILVSAWEYGKKPTNAQMMAQILKQDVYTESGKLKHLVNDKIMEKYIKKLEETKIPKKVKLG